MNLTFKGKTAIVTGASGGIGGAIALKLASQGASVGVHYNATKSNAEKICEDVRVAGGSAMPIHADVTDVSQVNRMFDDLDSEYGSVDILVNNAGINKDGLLIRMSDSDWDEVILVNLKGAFLCSRAAAKVMLKKRWGRIITISSIVGLVGNIGQAHIKCSFNNIIMTGFIITQYIFFRKSLQLTGFNRPTKCLLKSLTFKITYF